MPKLGRDTIEAEIYKLRRLIKPPASENDIRVGSVSPTVNDWNFAEIGKYDPQRAARLTAAGTSNDLLDTLETALRTAIKNDRLRFGVDCNDGNPRVIIQFPIARHIYDWFFNARTGYRGKFWAGANIGDEYNRAVVATLLKPLLETTPDQGTARKIAVHICGASREEVDEGPIPLRRETTIRSLDPRFAKIWICERLIHRHSAMGFRSEKWKRRRGITRPVSRRTRLLA